MAFTQTVNIRRNWERCPRTQGPVARWTILYATMTPDGDITISAHTHRTLGEPDSYVLLFDRDRSVIGLQPARSAIERTRTPPGTAANTAASAFPATRSVANSASRCRTPCASTNARSTTPAS